MKSKITILLVLALGSRFLATATDQNQPEQSEARPVTVLNYYHRLPNSPYFDNEIAEAVAEDRDPGIRYKNIKSGYLRGGHPMGPEFTMALFKNREEGIDYIMVHRLQYPGSMFEGFFIFLHEKEDGGWEDRTDLIDYRNSENTKVFYEELKEEQFISPVIPEKGTTVDFRKWNFTDTDQMEGELMFQFEWNGKSFDYKEVKN